MAVWRPKCPHCGSQINRASVKYGIPFACSSCGTLLHIPALYFRIPALASAVVCGMMAYMFGLSPLKVLVFTVVCWLPVAVVLGMLFNNAFHPKIEESPPAPPGLFPRAGGPDGKS